LYSAGVGSSIIGWSLFVAQPRRHLLDRLLVLRIAPALRSFRFGPAFILSLEVEQQLGGTPIAFFGSLDELLDDDLASADFSPRAVLGDRDKLVQCFGEQCREVLRAARAALRMPD